MLRPSSRGIAFSHVRPFALRLLRPRLTSRSASLRRTFIHNARSPRVRAHSFTARPPDLRCLTLDHGSFAAFCPLAPVGLAFYPVLVHRPAASLHASSPRSITLTQLRFASFAMVCLREDLHLQERARAGRTKERAPEGARRPDTASSRCRCVCALAWESGAGPAYCPGRRLFPLTPRA